MKMNLRNIEKITDVLQFFVKHFEQTFVEDDVYKACPQATSLILDLLYESNVIRWTNDGICFSNDNIEEYRSFLNDLEDEIDELNLSKDEKNNLLSRINIHNHMDFNLLSFGV